MRPHKETYHLNITASEQGLIARPGLHLCVKLLFIFFLFSFVPLLLLSFLFFIIERFVIGVPPVRATPCTRYFDLVIITTTIQNVPTRNPSLGPKNDLSESRHMEKWSDAQAGKALVYKLGLAGLIGANNPETIER